VNKVFSGVCGCGWRCGVLIGGKGFFLGCGCLGFLVAR